ncbi:MAG: histidine phosphatase family protein [Acidimicrobiia bacterium]
MALVERLAGYRPTAVISSPYRRAVDTVVPTARALGLEVGTRRDLREWDDGLETVEDWLPRYERCWADPDLRYGAGESHRELSIRATSALRDLLGQYGGETVIAASHGNWIARGLEGLGAPASPDFWRAMPNPAVFVIEHDGPRVSVTGPGLPT